MKKSLLGILLLFMLVGCGQYTEPSVTENVALIIIDEETQLDNGNGIDTRLEIDGKFIYPKRRVKVLSGQHNISIEISAYYDRRAKYAEAEKFSLILKPNHTYTIKIKTDKKILSTIDENVNAQYMVLDNKKILMKKSILLQDSAMRSLSKSPGLDPMILDSVIYHTVIMPL